MKFFVAVTLLVVLVGVTTGCAHTPAAGLVYQDYHAAPGAPVIRYEDPRDIIALRQQAERERDGAHRRSMDRQREAQRQLEAERYHQLQQQRQRQQTLQTLSREAQNWARQAEQRRAEAQRAADQRRRELERQRSNQTTRSIRR